MRLQDILDKTKLSKKAVYFYVKENLINPSKNIENGYYDFSDEDLSKLKIIMTMRKIGMSIQDIKEMFRYPTLTNFFIHRQINLLKSNICEQMDQLNTCYYIIENIPANATPTNVENHFEYFIKEKNYTHSSIERDFPSNDSRMITILLCAAFTHIESSQYHKFLLDRISSELKMQLENNLLFLKKMIYLLIPEQVHETSVHQYELYKRISECNEDEMVKYEEMLYENCKKLIESEELTNYWKLIYEPILIPTLRFLNSKTEELLREYNPVYTKYNDKIQKIASRVYERLSSDSETLDNLLRALDNKFNPVRFNYAELICMNTFKESIFTQVDLKILEELIITIEKDI